MKVDLTREQIKLLMKALREHGTVIQFAMGLSNKEIQDLNRRLNQALIDEDLN